jgi:hypothetical protein
MQALARLLHVVVTECGLKVRMLLASTSQRLLVLTLRTSSKFRQGHTHEQ